MVKVAFASLSSRSGRTSKHCQRRQAAAITAACHARPTPPLPGKKKEAESERKGKRNLMRREENRRGMGGDRRQGKRTGDEKGERGKEEVRAEVTRKKIVTEWEETGKGVGQAGEIIVRRVISERREGDDIEKRGKERK